MGTIQREKRGRAVFLRRKTDCRGFAVHRSVAKLGLMVIGVVFGLFCLLLGYIGTIRLYGWSQTGRLAPPHYPGLERFDLISFATDPLRAALEIGGNSLLVVISACGLVAVILTFRGGLDWIRNYPAFLPATFVAAFWATASAALVRHTEFAIPAAALLGSIAFVVQWIALRQKGFALTARVSDAAIFSQRSGPAPVRRPGRGLRIALALVLVIVSLMKLGTVFGL